MVRVTERTTARDLPAQQAVYMQMRTRREFDTVRRALVNLCVVRASGRGTASDPAAYWFELSVDAKEAATGLQERFLMWLQPFEVSIQRLQPIPAGMGAALSKQLDLFGGV